MKTKSLVIFAIFTQAVIACSSEQLPPGVRIEVTPQSKTIRISSSGSSTMSGCSVNDGSLYQDVPVLISVLDAQESPIGNAELTIYSDYTGNSFSGADVLRIYADSNSNGVIDHPAELVNGSDAGVYQTKTNRYDGTALVLVRMNLSCAYRGELVVFAGATSAQVKFAVEYPVPNTTVEETTVEETTGGDTTGWDTEIKLPRKSTGGNVG